MKKIKIVFYLLLTGVMLVSCDSMSPMFNDEENPFIVHEISGANPAEKMIWYYCKSGEGLVIDKFKAPKGMFTIGDTVGLCKINVR